MRRALVTGITGQDGGYLAEQLAAEGGQVHGLVRPGEVRPPHLAACGEAVVLHEVDLADEAGVRAPVRVAAPDEVYNLAGVSSGGCPVRAGDHRAGERVLRRAAAAPGVGGARADGP